jgi:hypothetical protein
VAVMRKQGGQFYYILDRLPKDEWLWFQT